MSTDLTDDSPDESMDVTDDAEDTDGSDETGAIDRII